MVDRFPSAMNSPLVGARSGCSSIGISDVVRHLIKPDQCGDSHECRLQLNYQVLQFLIIIGIDLGMLCRKIYEILL